MKIQAVSIDGFKNLSNVKIKFDNITALVALNNFGKSNVLSGIDFGLSFIKAPGDDKMKMMSNFNLVPINKRVQKRNYKFEVEVLTEDGGKEWRVQYGYEFSWRYNKDIVPEIIEEHLKIKLDEKGQKYTKLIVRTASDKATYKSSETGRCDSKINIEPTELVVNKLQAYDDIYYAEFVKKLNRMKFYIENNFNTNSFYVIDPIVRKGIDDMIIDDENLPRVIFYLQENHKDKYELLKNAYIELFPEIEDIIVKRFSLKIPKDNKIPDNIPFELANSIYALYVKDKSLIQPINFAMMSDGAKRLFMILTKIIVATISDISLIAIEEPENSVHPKLLQAYIQIISQLLDDCKVIITSHSPYIVSYLNPSWIHVGLNRKEGVAEFFTFRKMGQKQLQHDAYEFDMNMGDYLFSMLADPESNIIDYLECDLDG